MSSQPQPPSTNNFFQNRPVEFTVPISQPSNPSPPVQPLKPFSTFSELPSIKPSEPFTTFSENSFNNENPIVEIVSNTFDNSLPMENLIHPQPDNNNHLESSLPSLPQPVPENVGITSFVDSDRLNAGLGVSINEVDDNVLNHIPHDLWREDTVHIKPHKKTRITKVRRRSARKQIDTATPSYPELLVE